jgi:hypothetical protein
VGQIVRIRSGLWLVLAAMILLGVQGAQAGHTFNAQGMAVKDGVAYRVALGGQLQRFAEPGTSGFGVTIFQSNPSPEDAFGLLIIENAAFLGQTNFIDADEVPNPVVVQTDYWAISTTVGVDFQLNGTRTAQLVTAHGHFQEYEITIGPTLL